MRILAREFLFPSNLLSILRVVLTVPLIFLIRENTPTATHWIYPLILVAGISDILDGYVARRMNQTTRLGHILDPVADKLTLGGILVSLVLFRQFPLPLVIFLLYRDLGIVIGGWMVVRRTREVIGPNRWGKLNTLVFGLTCLTFIAAPGSMLYRSLAVAAYGLVFISGASYVAVARKTLCRSATQTIGLYASTITVTAAVVAFALRFRFI